MPTPAFLTVEGATQGPISSGANTLDSVGNEYQEAHQDEIMVEAFRHEVTVPTDVQSGQPTGQRMHKPLIVTKKFDKSSPLLYIALSSGERLTKCSLKFWRTSPEGIQENFFTIELEDAIVTNIQAYMYNCQDPSKSSFTNLEDVSFTYRKIKWTHEIGGTSGDDDWRAPRE